MKKITKYSGSDFCLEMKIFLPCGSDMLSPPWTLFQGRWMFWNFPWHYYPRRGGWCRSHGDEADICALSLRSPRITVCLHPDFLVARLHQAARNLSLQSSLTCPFSSNWLLVSLSLSKETTCFIHWAPFAGESGWTWIRGGELGSALPATTQLEVWNAYLEMWEIKMGV